MEFIKNNAEAIKQIQNILDWTKTHDYVEIDACHEEALQIAMETLEQEQKWIPVSEEPPKKNGWYSCTVDLSDSHYVTMDLYFKNGKWLDNRRIDMFYCYEIYGFGKSTEKHRLDYSELLEDFDWTEKVIAWMLLLEPYKAESEDKE